MMMMKVVNADPRLNCSYLWLRLYKSINNISNYVVSKKGIIIFEIQITIFALLVRKGLERLYS